jgi:hypothetical protein
MGQGLLALAVALLLLALLAILPARVAAQPAGAEAAPPGPVVADTMELRLEREVFNYPQFGRRNPFRPLVGDEAGPRFEDLQLLGVILSSEPGESVALLGIAQGMAVRPDSVAVESVVDVEPTVELARPTRSRTQRLRVGERWGSVRIVAIERNRVIVDVTEFGLTDRRELFLRRPDEGGIR